MALVDLKSNLSRVDSVPVETAVNLEKKPTPTSQKQYGVNFFTNYNARGFTLNKNNSNKTDFILINNDHPRNQSIFYDSKGDFVSTFTENKKATSFQESRLLLLHTEGVKLNSPLRQSDEGYTNYIGSLPLNNYYDLINNDNGVLGIRNDDVDSRFTTQKQPIIIRNNNQRWGDRKNVPEGLPDIAQTAINILDQLGGGVLGREPSIFIDRYIADIERLTGVANPLFSIFAENQRVLQRRNTFDQVTTVKYGLTNTNDKKSDNPLYALSQAYDLLLDPKIYNPASIYGPLSINRMGVLDIGANIRNNVVGIAGQISLGAIKLASKKAIKPIVSVLGQGLDIIGTGLINLGKSTGLSTRGILGDKATNALGDFAQSVGNSAEFISDKIQKGAEFVQDAGKFIAGVAGDLSGISGLISKGSAIKIDANAFADVGADKVNLIPYGKDEDTEGKKYYELDWIPFKFVDANNNKPIVFRAILSGITDAFSPEYAEERYIGRPDKVYVYQGTTREISFTFDVYPKSDKELVTLWEKLNYLAGLTYPHMENGQMVSPFCKLTIGQMYDDAPGYISALTYTVMDESTWEVDFAKLPKYVQVTCTYVYVGDRLPTATQKHYDVPWVVEEQHHKYRQKGLIVGLLENFSGISVPIDPQNFDDVTQALGGAVNDFF